MYKLEEKNRLKNGHAMIRNRLGFLNVLSNLYAHYIQLHFIYSLKLYAPFINGKIEAALYRQ